MDIIALANEYHSIIIALSIGGTIGYCSSYLKEKGKLRAAREETRRIEHEKQAVILEYSQKLEDRKQAHSKDIESIKQEFSTKLEAQKQEYAIDLQKRRYQYERKSDEYFKFMNELDTYHGFTIELIETEISGMMREYYESPLNNTKLTIDCNRKCMELLSNLRQQEANLFARVNALSLCTPDNVNTAIAALRSNINSSRGFAEDVLNYVFSPAFQYTFKIPAEILNKHNGLREDTFNKREQLKKALKEDLDKI
ncbi:TPA: hypothetical protein QEM96_003971 [Pseudomonas putida]|nr:hypothetical protein [Pseudomonas putida]